MKCKECDGKTETLETRTYHDKAGDFYWVQRRRRCLSCGEIFKTIEVEAMLFAERFADAE